MSRMWGVSIVVVAGLALSALGASIARGEVGAGFSAGEYPATVDLAGEGTQTLKIGNLPAFTCEEVTGHSSLKETADRLTVNDIQYSGCHAVTLGLTFPVTIDVGDCHLTFTADTYFTQATEGNGGGTGNIHLDCAGEDEVTITVFKAESSGHSAEDLRCTIHIPEQTVKEEPVRYDNESAGNLTNIAAELEKAKLSGTLTSSMICGEEGPVSIDYSGSLLFSAVEEEEAEVSMEIHGEER